MGFAGMGGFIAQLANRNRQISKLPRNIGKIGRGGKYEQET